MSDVSAATAPSPYTRSNPFPAKLAVNRLLSGPDSEKETRHFEIDLKGWGLAYEPGDSLAVYPSNDPELVSEILSSIGATRGRTHFRRKNPETAARSATARFLHHSADTAAVESHRRARLGCSAPE